MRRLDWQWISCRGFENIFLFSTLIMRRLLLPGLIGASMAMAIVNNASGFDFGALREKLPPEAEIPAREPYDARDGTRLWYRHYPGAFDTALVLAHGSASDSKYLSYLAGAIAESGVATVYTPDLRGHGPSPVRRGDIDYIDQLVDDLADFVSHVKATRDDIDRVIIGGHSSGGGLAVRFAGSRHGNLADGYLLLAPYLGHDAPTTRGSSGGWADPDLFKIIPISLVNVLGITFANDTKVLHFNMPPEHRDGSETLSYSYRLMKGFNPTDFRAGLESVATPLLLVVGSDDTALYADKFESTIRPLVPQAAIRTVSGGSHLGLVINDEVIEIIRKWLHQL